MIVTHEYPCRHFYKILRSSTQAKWHIGLIVSRWYKDDIIEGNVDIWQQAPISLCVESDQYQSNDEHITYKFDYIKQIRGAEVYNSTLQKINTTRQRYGRAQGLMRKALDIAIATDSYDELIGICHGFILDKQRSQESDTKMEEAEYDIKNPIIIT
jgi:hypothetical protein